MTPQAPAFIRLKRSRVNGFPPACENFLLTPRRAPGSTGTATLAGMTRPLHIVHAVEKNRLTTGSVAQAMDAACGLAQRGHRVTVVARPGGDLEAACAAAGARFLPLALRHRLDVASVLRLRRLLRSERVDLVHAHKGVAHWLGLVAAVGLGRRPVVVVNRGVTFPLDLFNRWKYRHPRVAAVICVAEAVRRVVLASTGLPPDRATVVYAGTDTERFDPGRVDAARTRRELGLELDGLVIGTVSVRDWKGWRELLEAFARVIQHHPRARVMVVGCEPAGLRERVEAAASALGIGGRLRVTGFRCDMPEVLAACDVVADASWAGTGITGTVREAMAMARPVVATDCGGNRELVTDGEVGLLVPPRDVAALAMALDRLLADGQLRTRFGIAGRRRVVELFSLDRRLDALERLYREVTRGES